MDLEGSGHGLIQILSQYLLQGTDKNLEKTSFRISGVLIKIATAHFLSISLEYYHYTNLFSMYSHWFGINDS
jgi:hypothetical protein